MIGGRAKVSRLSMVLGVAFMVAGVGIRVGAVPTTLGGGSGGPRSSGSPMSGDPSATPVMATRSPVPDVSGPPATPSPVTSAAPDTTLDSADLASPAVSTLWFADDFDTVAAWPVGPLDWLATAVADGTYLIDAQPTDLPVVVMAAAGEGSPGDALTVTVELAFTADADPEAGAGPVIEDDQGTRLLALVSADGRVTLFRDSVESLDLLASGSISPPSGPVELELSVDANGATVSVDGVPVTSATASLAPIAFGLAVWVVSRSTTIVVDAYRVWVVDGAA